MSAIIALHSYLGISSNVEMDTKMYSLFCVVRMVAGVYFFFKISIFFTMPTAMFTFENLALSEPTGGEFAKL